MRLIPKNWGKFQHYKDRSPPWIKLHREILDDREFMLLPIASKALAPLLWLLASESKDGSFDASEDELIFRLRVTSKDLAGLKPLIDKGFFVVASNALSDCQQDARPEGEGETERETTLSDKSDAVEILNYLNLKVGSKYRPVDTNLNLVKARLKVSTAEEIKAVIDDRVNAWASDEKMAEFLRPQTLFRASNFESYIGGLGKKSQGFKVDL